MPAQPGRTALVKIDNTGAGSYQTIAGTRQKALKLNTETVDVTNADSTNQWRELLANAGVKSIEVSCSGVFLDDVYINTLVTLSMANTIRNFQYIHPGLGTFQGPFQIQNLELPDEYNGAAEFSFTLASAGEITFTPV